MVCLSQGLTKPVSPDSVNSYLLSSEEREWEWGQYSRVRDTSCMVCVCVPWDGDSISMCIFDAFETKLHCIAQQSQSVTPKKKNVFIQNGVLKFLINDFVSHRQSHHHYHHHHHRAYVPVAPLQTWKRQVKRPSPSFACSS